MTGRHDDAMAAVVDAADRAILSLSVYRGLGDARIAHLTGVDVDAVQARRERVLATVAAHLGILPDEVPAALRAAAADDGEPLRLMSPPPRLRRRTRRPWVIALGLLGLAGLGLAILVIDGRSTRRRAPRIRPADAAHPPVTARPSASLRPLPGGPQRASGTLTLRRHRGTLTLEVKLSSLPTLRRGHYAAFLYDSILRSRPLGVVRPRGVTRLRLPADAARYREIDISDQPRGVVNPSGESRLRGPNPVLDYARGARRGSRSSALSTR